MGSYNTIATKTTLQEKVQFKEIKKDFRKRIIRTIIVIQGISLLREKLQCGHSKELCTQNTTTKENKN